MRKKRFLLGAVALTAALAATGCGGTNGSQAADNAKTQADTGKDSGSQDSGNKDSGVKDTSKADEADRNISCTLTLATWDVAAAKTFEELDMEGRFQQLYPNVEIDIEEFNAEPEYFNSMKIRSSASELPDLMFHKSDSMNQYSEYLADLTDTKPIKITRLPLNMRWTARSWAYRTARQVTMCITGQTCLMRQELRFLKPGMSSWRSAKSSRNISVPRTLTSAQSAWAQRMHGPLIP